MLTGDTKYRKMFFRRCVGENVCLILITIFRLKISVQHVLESRGKLNEFAVMISVRLKSDWKRLKFSMKRVKKFQFRHVIPSNLAEPSLSVKICVQKMGNKLSSHFHPIFSCFKYILVNHSIVICPLIQFPFFKILFFLEHLFFCVLCELWTFCLQLLTLIWVQRSDSFIFALNLSIRTRRSSVLAFPTVFICSK